MSAYAASKAALNAMVTTLSAELKQDGIRVNAVMPSIIDTATNRRDMPNADPTKWVAAEDIAEFLYDLTLSKSKSISGALIPIPGRV
jgi:NAD(P)-dependent dehydrogenase (short-subunit alcohol dehydrogenase family)